MADELDFTKHFSADHPVAEPQPSPEVLRGIDELGTIGEAQLKSTGFYTRIVSAAPAGRPRAPGETLVLVVEDNDTTAHGDRGGAAQDGLSASTRRCRTCRCSC